MRTYTANDANDIDRLLSELPGKYQLALDALHRERKEREFSGAHCDVAVEFLNDQEESCRAWDERLVPVASEFLIGVHAGEIPLGPRQVHYLRG